MEENPEIKKHLDKMKRDPRYQAGIELLQETWDSWKQENPDVSDKLELDVWLEWTDGFFHAVRGEM